MECQKERVRPSIFASSGFKLKSSGRLGPGWAAHGGLARKRNLLYTSYGEHAGGLLT